MTNHSCLQSHCRLVLCESENIGTVPDRLSPHCCPNFLTRLNTLRYLSPPPGSFPHSASAPRDSLHFSFSALLLLSWGQRRERFNGYFLINSEIIMGSLSHGLNLQKYLPHCILIAAQSIMFFARLMYWCNNYLMPGLRASSSHFKLVFASLH